MLVGIGLTCRTVREHSGGVPPRTAIQFRRRVIRLATPARMAISRI